VNAFGDSSRCPPRLSTLFRSVSNSATPPLLGVHSSVWSHTTKCAGAPFADRASAVRRWIFPYGRLTNVPIGSSPGYSSITGPRVSMSISGDHVFVSTCCSDTAAISTSGLRISAHGIPTGWPSASQPSGTAGPSASNARERGRERRLPPAARPRDHTATNHPRPVLAGISR
jgi:hypothetical protein